MDLNRLYSLGTHSGLWERAGIADVVGMQSQCNSMILLKFSFFIACPDIGAYTIKIGDGAMNWGSKADLFVWHHH